MTFDLHRALQLARYSQSAYDFATIHAEETDTQVLVQDVPGTGETVVAFRGTADLRDAFTDARIALRAEAGGRVHTGFAAAVESIVVELSQAMRPVENRKFWFTGHSLGGALAALAAFTMARQGFPIAGVYTFCAPRFCDGQFRDTYNYRLGPLTWRLTRAYDIVPHLPLPGLILPYRHVGLEAEITPWNTLRLNPSWLETSLRDIEGFFTARSVLKANPFDLPGEILDLHSIGHVISDLAALQTTGTGNI